MISRLHFIYLVILLIFSSSLESQTIPDSLIKYTPEFKFTDGIFPDFESVQHNNPIPKNRIISSVSYDDNDFFDKTLALNKVYYYDNLGDKLELSTDKIWGYSRNGFLYIHIEDSYFRITLIGSICHFVGIHSYETYSPNYYNSYYYDSPYYPRNTTTATEQRQYLFDFKTGRVLDYDEEGVEILLMADPELHDEYVQLSNKKKNQLKFLYIRKFNERNPLYLIKTKKE